MECLDSEPVIMTTRNDGPPVLGIDLGGTKILVGAVSGNHRILGRASGTTPAKEAGRRSSRRLPRVRMMHSNRPVFRGEIAAAGIGSPGPLDQKTGTILFSAK